MGVHTTEGMGLKEPMDIVKWQIDKSEELGCTVFQPGFPCPEDDDSLKYLRDYAGSRILSWNSGLRTKYSALPAPMQQAAAAIKEGIRKGKLIGANILRTGYGRFHIDTTRFSKNIPVKQHLETLANNLKEAAKIFEDEGVYCAIENHCDFTGKEWAEVFAAVGSPYIGCALDTGNGYTVYCDPNEDVEVLAEYTITTHIKDMAVIPYDSKGDLIPFQARGVVLGEGNVDIPRTIDILDQKCPHANGLHLVLELGWANYVDDVPRDIQNRELTEKCLVYLHDLLKSNKQYNQSLT